ncbi:DUF2304 domain-containing protein [Actinomadura rudentiformis]|uniref:DUF2304 domain-containing protein n=1 Tax=Actinomadura rudentiformis TaxID=359158 RepID=A0A6H9Z620_9ACTN|nr:DUF2304 domain-containing protein [Actinomadura rudentiformis]KAB2351549.1 DUF2304 domain-containing protein [Actinomadura rudentiformis]
MKAYHLGLIGAAIALLVIFEMLRRRRMREKYAITWVVLAVFIVLIAAFPGILTWAADLTGVEVPANLLFFGASLLLLAMNVQLSSEVSRLEDKVRTLAEELGLQRLRIEQVEHVEKSGAAEHEPAHDGTSGDVS